VHLVDAGVAEPETRIRAVRAVLDEIGAGRVPEQIVFTKSDTVGSETLHQLLASHAGAIGVSGRTGAGVEELPVVIGDRLRAMERVLELAVPYDRGDILAALYRAGEVLVEVHDDGGTRVKARLSDAAAGRFSEFSATTA
jgi:GTP-binding protein HflX